MQVSNNPLGMVPPQVDARSLEFSSESSREEVATSLESVFASMLIKEMRNTLSEGIFGSEQSDVFGGLFDLHMGKAMTDGRGLGIKQIIVSQLESESQLTPESK